MKRKGESLPKLNERQRGTLIKLHLALSRECNGECLAAIQWHFRVEEPDDQSLTDLGLPERVVNALERNGVLTVRHLCKQSVADLMSINGMSYSSVEQIQTKLGERGLSLKRLAFIDSIPTPSERIYRSFGDGNIRVSDGRSDY